MRLTMGLHPALDEARWFFIVFGTLLGLCVITGFFWHDGAMWHTVVLYGSIPVAMLCAYAIIAIDAWRRRRALSRGVRCTASVLSTESIDWSSRTGGQTFRLTLRYELNGAEHTSTRAVRPEVARRLGLKKAIEIAVTPAAPRHWYPAE